MKRDHALVQVTSTSLSPSPRQSFMADRSRQALAHPRKQSTLQMVAGATGTILLQLPSTVSLPILQRLERRLDPSMATVMTGRPVRRDLHRAVNIGVRGSVDLRRAGPLLLRRLVAHRAGLPLRAFQHRPHRILPAPQPQPGSHPRAALPLPGTALTHSIVQVAPPL